MGVSKIRGTPKMDGSLLKWIILGYRFFWKHGNTHIDKTDDRLPSTHFVTELRPKFAPWY